jgi:hypothetical protein
MSAPGSVAERTTVALYAVLVKAGRPLTFAEVCSHMRAAHGTWQNDANIAFGESLSPAVLAALPDPLPEALLDEAWEFWIEALLKVSVNTKRISVNRADGGAVARGQWGHVPRSEKAYAHNPDNPPMVAIQPITVGGIVYLPQGNKRVAWSEAQDDVVQRQLDLRRAYNAIEAALAKTPRAKTITIDREIAEAALRVMS